jgi:DNA-binding NarL/FixJ family response regulator
MIGWDADSADRQHLLIVHETGRRWIDMLRGSSIETACSVRHCASIQDTLASAWAAPCSTLLIELGRRSAESLDLLEQLSGLAKELTAIVLARSDQAGLELAARELGASVFLREPLTGTELARTVGSVVRLQLELAETRENLWAFPHRTREGV